MNYSILIEILKDYNITDFSIIPADKINDFELPTQTPKELSYLQRTQRRHPRYLYPQVKDIFIAIFQYWHSKLNYEKIISKIIDPYDFLAKKYNLEKTKFTTKNNFKIARYALVEEYHKKIKQILKDILNRLKQLEKNIDGKIFVDTSPIFEKRIAQLAGLGFIGKNTLLISSIYGSYVFIGGILLNTKIENYFFRKPQKSQCYSCKICIDSCPTKALSENGLDPSKCISFWTTHTKNKIPDKIINSSNYVFGCDICQEVCPFNKISKEGKSIFIINNQ